MTYTVMIYKRSDADTPYVTFNLKATTENRGAAKLAAALIPFVNNAEDYKAFLKAIRNNGGYASVDFKKWISYIEQAAEPSIIITSFRCRESRKELLEK